MYMEQFEDKATPMQLQEEYEWAVGIFPALHKYKTEHNADNLKKLCVEVLEFCRAIYASTQSDKEREVYNEIISKVKPS